MPWHAFGVASDSGGGARRFERIGVLTGWHSIAHPHRVDENFSVWSRSVQFHSEQPLPGAELKLAIEHGDAFAPAEEQVQAVRVTVRALIWVHVLGPNREIIVAVGCIRGCQARQKGLQVLQQQRLVFLNAHGKGRVPRKDAHQTVTQAGGANHLNHLVGDVQELNRRRGLELQTAQRGDRRILSRKEQHSLVEYRQGDAHL